MNPARPTIAGLMGYSLLAAVGIAALRTPREMNMRGLYVLVAAMFAWAAVRAVRDGSRRAWRMGFAAGGVGWLLLCLSPLEASLPNERVFDWVYANVSVTEVGEVSFPGDRFDESASEWLARPDVHVAYVTTQPSSEGNEVWVRYSVDHTEHVRRSVDALASLAVGWAVGLVAATGSGLRRRLRSL